MSKGTLVIGIPGIATIGSVFSCCIFRPYLLVCFNINTIIYFAERAALSKLEGRQRDLQQSVEALETDTMTITNTKDR